MQERVNIPELNTDHLNQEFMFNHEQAVQPEFSGVNSRFRSFQRWPVKERGVINFFPLIRAGFYLKDIDDTVRCFHCDGMFTEFENINKKNIWEIHMESNAECLFAKIISRFPPMHSAENVPTFMCPACNQCQVQVLSLQCKDAICLGCAVSQTECKKCGAEITYLLPFQF